MGVVLLGARLLLAAVFAVAGVAKLKDQSGFRRALVDFGVPQPIVPAVGVGVALAELVVAVGLLLTSAAWWGALGAAVLLLIFTAGITVNLLHGHAPDCHCFGQVHSEPASWKSVIRNAVLALPAGIIIWHGGGDTGPSLTAWTAHLTGFEAGALAVGVVIVGVLIVQGWVILQLFQQYGRLLLRLEALEGGQPPLATQSPGTVMRTGVTVGAEAPRFTLPHIEGGRLSLDDLLSIGRPVMLLFADPSCGSCAAILPEVSAVERGRDASVTVALVSRGDVDSNREKMAVYGFRHILLQSDTEIAADYGVPGTPSAVIIRPNGTVGTPIAIGVPAIQALLLNLPLRQLAAVSDA